MEPVSTEQIEKIAVSFVDILQEWLTPSEFAQVAKDNRTPAYADCCASHDYCDANVAMDEAFKKEGIYTDETMDLQDDNLMIAWDAAWNRAKKLIAQRAEDAQP